MTMAIDLDLVHIVAPQALEKARQLDYAIKLLKDGYTTREANAILRQQYSISRMTAWRVLDKAHDVVYG